MNHSLGFCHVIIMWPLFQIDTRSVTMTRDVPASETRVNMPVARPCDMRFSRNSRHSLRSRRSPIYFLAPATQATVAKGKEEAWNHHNRVDSSNLDSGLQCLDSGFHRPKLPGFRIPDYLTWGEILIAV